MAALRRDFLPGDLAPVLTHAGFDRAVAVQACQTVEETHWLLALAEAHPFIAGVIGWVDLQADDVRDQLRRLASSRRLLGIRHIVQSEPDDRFLLRPAFCRGIAALEEFGLTYDLLLYARHLPVAIDFAARFERQTFVLDHLAKPGIRGREIDRWAKDLERLARLPNVCGKLSGLVTEADWVCWTPEDLHPYLDVAFECFGADRLMIGSDWPVCTVAADYARTMRVVMEHLNSHPQIEQDAVLGGNAARVWNLNVQVPRGRQ
jgi:L-fucono-1,5-lactonase